MKSKRITIPLTVRSTWLSLLALLGIVVAPASVCMGAPALAPWFGIGAALALTLRELTKTRITTDGITFFCLLRITLRWSEILDIRMSYFVVQGSRPGNVLSSLKISTKDGKSYEVGGFFAAQDLEVIDTVANQLKRQGKISSVKR